MAAPQENDSPLLKLPGEMQNKIFRYIVVDHAPINLIMQNKNLNTIGPLTPPQPALMRVCREIREQVGPIYYAENTFAFDAEDTFITVVGEDKKKTSYRPTIKAFEIQAGSFAAHIDHITLYNDSLDAPFHTVSKAYLENGSVRSTVDYPSYGKLETISELPSTDQRVMRNILLEWLKAPIDIDEETNQFWEVYKLQSNGEWKKLVSRP